MSRKATHKTNRETISRFEEIINVGPATTRDFKQMGYKKPQDLIGQTPLRLYQKLCRMNGKFYDPCVLDVFMATVDYMNGNRPRQWWDYTAERKHQYSNDIEKLRNKYS